MDRREIQARPGPRGLQQVPGEPRDQAGRRLAEDQRYGPEPATGGAGQTIYVLPGNAGSGGAIYYRHRYYVNDLASGYNRSDPSTWQIAAPQVSTPSTKGLLGVPPGQLEGGAQLHPEPRRALGAAGRAWTASARPPSRSATTGRRASASSGTSKNDGRSKLYAALRALLRGHPAGHQHPRVRRRGRLLLLQLQPEPRRHPARSGSLGVRPCSGGPEPVDPNLKGQFIDECRRRLRAGGRAELQPRP